MLVLDSLTGRPVSLDEAVGDHRVEAVGGWTLVALIVTAVLWCVWQHRAHTATSGRSAAPAWRTHPPMGRGLVVHPFAEPLEALGRDVGSSEGRGPRATPTLGVVQALVGVRTVVGVLDRANFVDVVAGAMQQETDLSTVASSDIVAVVACPGGHRCRHLRGPDLRDILGRQRTLASMSGGGAVAPAPPGPCGAAHATATAVAPASAALTSSERRPLHCPPWR